MYLLKNNCIFSYRRLGDFMIDLYVYRALKSNGHYLNFYLTNSNLELAKLVLKKGEYIEVDFNHIPLIFNLKKNIFKLINILFDTLNFKNKLNYYFSTQRIHLSYSDIRVNFIFKSFDVTFPIKKKNIYDSFYKSVEKNKSNDVLYHKYLKKFGYVIIAPYSSSRKKDIPSILLHLIIEFLNEKKIKFKVIDDKSDNKKLFGENFLLTKDLKLLKDNIINCKALICADSFIGHFAHFFKRPVFTVLNFDNEYFLPFMTYRNGSYYIKEENDKVNNLKIKLDYFFNSI